jgi:hypothetical protein
MTLTARAIHAGLPSTRQRLDAARQVLHRLPRLHVLHAPPRGQRHLTGVLRLHEHRHGLSADPCGRLTRRPFDGVRCRLGFGRIVASETEVPNMLVDVV